MHIDEIDPNGETFRYPTDRKGKPFNYTRVEIEGLVRAHHHVTLITDASISMLQDSLP